MAGRQAVFGSDDVFKYLKFRKKTVISGFRGSQPSYVNFAPEMTQKVLHFVQRGRILLRCGSASRYRCPPWAFPP
jgi:hypothetical protein